MYNNERINRIYNATLSLYVFGMHDALNIIDFIEHKNVDIPNALTWNTFGKIRGRDEIIDNLLKEQNNDYNE